MGKRIYMDEDMLESYGSIHEASEAFLNHISLENMTLDTELQLEFGFDNDDLFSTQAMEAISDTVKNMASKAKSNFVTYAKKLINFLFGWLINFFRGATNVKKAMRSSYEKARTYLKKLNEYESKARSASKDSNIEITDYGNCVVVGLSMIQMVIIMFEELSAKLKKVSETSGDNNDKSIGNNRAFKMLTILLRDITDLYFQIGSIDISNTSDLVSRLKAGQWSVKAAADSFDEKTKNAKAEDKFKIETDEAGKVNANTVVDMNELDLTIDERFNKETIAKFKARIEETSKYLSEPNKAEMTYTKAFDELRSKLNIFINISKANKWDFEKHVSAVEKIRRGLEKEISNIDTNEVNEKYVSKLLQYIVNLGNSIGQVQKSMSTVTKSVVGCIDGMTTDVAKLGSKLTTIKEG